MSHARCCRRKAREFIVYLVGFTSEDGAMAALEGLLRKMTRERLRGLWLGSPAAIVGQRGLTVCFTDAGVWCCMWVYG